jgi:hypothetical protein
LLAPRGLDRSLRTVFRIDPALMACIPDKTACDSADVASALDFLANDWLADVATDFSGKCVLVCVALTIIERILLPERPAFFVTAGKRGGGKTTALAMIVLAVTGKRPAAAAWSSSEEERRKAIFSYLAEGVPAVVWDNIPLGSTISCKTLEAVLTTDSYSDRILGQPVNRTVPSFTVMAFTGNNISPKGDTASRSLMARLAVNRPDPENRSFQHSDPITWTLDNQGEILRALYTLLLGNPQLTKAGRIPPRTRFKTWWTLVGSAVEHAARCLTEFEMAHPGGEQIATQIDMVKMFAVVEADDEEANTLSDVLEVLNARWPVSAFLAADVTQLINNPSQREIDLSLKLRGFFEIPGQRGGGDLLANAVGRRLRAILDTPVYVGDRVMTLQLIARSNDRKQAARYQVRAA